ncbi:RNA-dependent RNA polymerase [Erysiphe necator associated ourmia-like virus 104]|nr:RNA-dependent RNA polymerase [Erysiphe necator associated ourmia-like virus 104]
MSLSNDQPAARQCRVYQTRTTKVVQRAIQTWERIFHQPQSDYDLRFAPTCSAFAKKVKSLLGNCPAEDQDQIMAWQSIKKLLPDSCRCMEATMLSDLKKTLSRPPRSLPRGYLRFVQQEVRKLFPPGWDRGLYEDHVVNTSPPLSSTTESSRSDGGSLGSGMDHASFLEACLGDVDFELDCRAKMIVVQSAGKPRALSKFSSDVLCLRPLHKAIYDRLSRNSWLNRGDVTTEGLKDFRYVEGEVLTSGDYKSATDNLSIEVAEMILATILTSTVSVPQSVMKGALDILRPNLYNLENALDFVPRIGQMMGSYLSFPLLCIQNRMAFLWCGGGNRPCKINGDDILFRSDPEFSQRWMETVSSLGLEVERTKTSVSADYGSLNSTLVVREKGRYKVRQTYRFGMLRECDDITSLCKTYEDFLRGIHGPSRFRAGFEFFRWHLPSLKAYRVSTVELGFRGDLAWRLTRKWNLRLDRPSEVLPTLGPDHNVVVPRDICTFVDPDTIRKDDRKVSAMELAAWKWGVEFASRQKRSELEFKLRMSLIRQVRPDFNPYLSGFGEKCRVSRPTWAETRRPFLVPRPVRKDCFPLMIEVEEQLPPYTEHEDGVILIDVKKDK